MTKYRLNDSDIKAEPYVAGMESGFSTTVPHWVDYTHLLKPEGPYAYFKDTQGDVHWLKSDSYIVTFLRDMRTTVMSAGRLSEHYSPTDEAANSVVSSERG